MQAASLFSWMPMRNPPPLKTSSNLDQSLPTAPSPLSRKRPIEAVKVCSFGLCHICISISFLFPSISLLKKSNFLLFPFHAGTSPFDFAHHSLTSLKITVDGEVFPSIRPFSPDFDSTTAPDWTREYLALQDYQLKVDSGTMISYDLFKSHFAFYIFHMGRESSLANDHTSPKRAGSARLDVTFSSTSTNPALTLLLYTESDEIITIDQNRRVNRDYHL